MAAESLLLQDLGFIVLAGTFFALVLKRLNQPVIVAYILAGIVVGSAGLGLVRDYQNIGVLSELGVAFLLFAVGLEIDFSKMWAFRRHIVLVGLGQVFLTTTIVASIMHAFGLTLIESAYVGLALAFSSTVLVVKLLSEQKRVNSLEGKLIVGYALVQDLTAVLLLPFLANPSVLGNAVPFFGLAVGVLFLFALAFALNRFLFPRLLRFAAGTPEIFYLTIVSSCFAFIFLSQALSFSIATGAFIGGLALSRLAYNSEAQHIVRYIRDLFVTVFFVSLGIQLQAVFLGGFAWILAAMILVVFVLNPLIFTVLNLYSGFGVRTSVFIGFALAQASEFSFILANQGFRLQQVSEPVYNLLIWTILFSMIATPYMMRLSNRFVPMTEKMVSWLGPRFVSRRLEGLERLPPESEMQNHVLLAGAGVFGQVVAKELSQRETVVVVDSDPVVVSGFIQNGFSAVFASRDNFEVWEKVRLQKARLLVVTIPDALAGRQLARLAKSINPAVTIVARAHYYRDARELYAAGADLVVMPQVMASNYALKTIQEFLATGKKPRASVLQEEYFKVLQEKAFEEEKNGF